MHEMKKVIFNYLAKPRFLSEAIEAGRLSDFSNLVSSYDAIGELISEGKISSDGGRLYRKDRT